MASFDYANGVQNGESETLIGTWLKTQDRSKIIVATKLGSHGVQGNINTPGLSRHNILR